MVVKKEKAEAIEDEQDDKQDLALFIDKLQDKLARLKALALASKGRELDGSGGTSHSEQLRK